MQGLYGSLWVDRWRTGEMVERGGQTFDCGLLNAKATWAQELGGFAGMADRIAKALENCRHRNLPPTLPEFLDLCRQQHGDGPAALPSPKLSRDEVAPRIAEVARKVTAPRADMLAWARFPPEGSTGRGPWETAITELVEAGDDRFDAILAMHVDAGVIKSERALKALGRHDEGVVAA